MIFSNTAELLLVEDNPNDLELTMRALKNAIQGHTIQVVRDGAEALEYLACQGRYSRRSPTQLPKVILLDLKLRKVDGIEVLRQIKSSERTKMIPIVMLTSSKQDSDLSECYRLGVNSYLVKPSNFSHFADALSLFGHYWLTLNQLPH